MAKKGKFDINAVSIPTFSVTLLSGKIVTVRSIIMKEYRNLLLAKDGSDDAIDHVDAIEQVVRNCIIDDVDEKSLTAYDFELIFIKAFQFGTGERNIRLNYQCTNHVEKLDEGTGELQIKKCGSLMKTAVDLNTIKPSTIFDKMSTEDKEFEIQENVVLTLRCPTFKDTTNFNATSNEGVISTIINNFKSIRINDIITPAHDITDEDMEELFERISPLQIKEMFDFVVSIPRVSANVKVKCPSCGKKYEQKMIGIEDFFV